MFIERPMSPLEYLADEADARRSFFLPRGDALRRRRSVLPRRQRDQLPGLPAAASRSRFPCRYGMR